jgi:hypothetical protein
MKDVGVIPAGLPIEPGARKNVSYNHVEPDANGKRIPR